MRFGCWRATQNKLPRAQAPRRACGDQAERSQKPDRKGGPPWEEGLVGILTGGNIPPERFAKLMME